MPNTLGRREVLGLGSFAMGSWILDGAGSAARANEPGAAITDTDIRKLVELMEEERQAWIEGRFDPLAEGELAQASEMTIFGPFGGPAPPPGPEMHERQRKSNAAFQGGRGSCELVTWFAEGNLVVLVLVERNEVMFEGKSEPTPWNLRTTQVFRHEQGRWIRLHRHADPLWPRRNLEDTIALGVSE